jgi:hypothetical protein
VAVHHASGILHHGLVCGWHPALDELAHFRCVLLQNGDGLRIG